MAVAALERYKQVALLRTVAVDAPERGRGTGLTLVGERLPLRASAVSITCLPTTTAAPLFRRFGFTDAARAAAPPELHASAELATLCPTAAFMALAL